MMAAQSLTSRPSEIFMPEAERREKLRREQAVKEFYQRNERVYVGETAFNSAWAKINLWINFQSLMGHLMRNGLVNSASDMEELTSPYLTAAMRHANLKRMLEANGGDCGHFIFYMSLCDSLESNPLGHGDAVDELKRCAVECDEIPPWLRARETGRSMSYPSSSYSSFSSLDSSSEMGPQTMPSVSSFPPAFTPSTSANKSVPPQQPPMTSQSSSSSNKNSTQSSTQPISCDPSGQPTSSASASAQPQSLPKMGATGKSPQNTSGSSRPAAHIYPAYYPKLESHQMVYPSGNKDARKLGTAATESGGAALVQGSGKSSIFKSYGVPSKHAFNKETYISNETLSSFENKNPWTIPQPEVTQWSTNSYLSDADTERDGSEHTQTARADSSSAGAEQSDKPISLADIERLVTLGDIDILSSKYDEEVDLDFPDKADITNSSDFMDTLCRFVCAVLNARSSKKIGVFLGGVRALEGEKEPYAVVGVEFSDTVINSIEQRYIQRLAKVLRSRVDDQEKEVTREEQGLVRLKFVDVAQSRENRSCKVALVTVVPDVKVCKNHMYLCQFRDSSGRARSECYKRLEGETVHLRQQKKITVLKNSLNNT